MPSCCLCCNDPPNYVNGKPTVSGGDVISCFENGRLFRVIKGKKWYYYNDTQESVMLVTMQCGVGSVIKALGNTEFHQTASSGAGVAKLRVMPLETEPFIKGKPQGFNIIMKAEPFTDEQKRVYMKTAHETVAKNMQKVRGVLKKAKEGAVAAMKNEDRAVYLCIKYNVPYVDMNFPPIADSLRPSSDTSTRNRRLENLNDFAWRRPRDYLPRSWHKKIALYRKKITPQSIDQGTLGDCWFLCSISALAEEPKNIRSLFLNPHWCCRKKQERRAGAYRVTLNINGIWRTLIVDDYLPSTSKLPCFARSRHSPCDLWVSLLEKAYAKAYGSYAAISGGSPTYALQDLTGFPSFYFKKLWNDALKSSDSADKFFKLLHQWRHQKYLITVDTPSEDVRSYSSRRRMSNIEADEVERLYKKAGLAMGHAYTVLAVRYFPLHRLCMLKIRNPWANDVEWSGDWSDNSDMWKKYPIIKALCRPEKKNDGVFWMEWKDVVKFFEDGCVCFYRPGRFEYRIPAVFDGEVPNIVLEVVVKEKKKFKAFVMLQQRETRGLPPGHPESQQTGLLITIFAADGKRQKLLCCSSENPVEPSDAYLFLQGKSVGLYQEFLPEQSPYYIVPRRLKGSGTDPESKKVVLSLLSKSKVTKSNVEVNLKRLRANCDVFHNYKMFDAGSAESVKTCFQYRSENKLPVAMEGKSLHNARKVSSSKLLELIV